jgi:hypothetical protein
MKENLDNKKGGMEIGRNNTWDKREYMWQWGSCAYERNIKTRNRMRKKDKKGYL